jgi:hypothetical protein
MLNFNYINIIFTLQVQYFLRTQTRMQYLHTP